MIATVTLNPCIDRTVTVEDFQPGATNRVLRTRQDVSGKGINVSAALSQLGFATEAVGISRRENGALLEEFLDGMRIPRAFACAEGELRVNLKIFDRAAGRMTECNERGNPVGEEALDDFWRIVRDTAARAEVLVLSGSVPEGVPATIYREIIDAVHRNGLQIAVDAGGPLLAQAIGPHTDLIKPNLAEFQQLCGRDLPDRAAVLTAARGILARGVGCVCVSLGGEGALLVRREGAWFCEAPRVPVRGLQGAGDSMVAGICAAMAQGLPPAEMLRWGAAACGGSIQREGTLLCRREDFDALLPSVTAEPVG